MYYSTYSAKFYSLSLSLSVSLSLSLSLSLSRSMNEANADILIIVLFVRNNTQLKKMQVRSSYVGVRYQTTLPDIC